MDALQATVYKLFLPLAEINSQVNEQEKAGLQRIQGQLAYMTADNFMFTISLFLCLKKHGQEKEDRYINPIYMYVVYRCRL